MSNETGASLRTALAAAAVLAAVVAGAVLATRDDAPAVVDAAVVTAADAGPTVALHDAAIAPDAAPLPYAVHEGELDEGETVSELLQEFGLDAGAVHAVVQALSGVYDFRQARAGARCEVRLDRADGRLLRLTFEAGPLDVFEVERDAEGKLQGRRVEIPVRLVETEVGARIEGSLDQTMQALGETPALVALVVDVFAWDIDFFRDQHPGDQFRVVVEKVYKEEDFIRYGRILAAEYAGKAGTFRVFWFQTDPNDEKTGGYFLEDGRSARKTFLATPLKFTRISSGFGKRKHPVLGYTKAHMGVDYAAPTGTPVWAMADGKVTWAGPKGANGNLVVIEHAGGLTSHYAHLHRIARGVRAGVRVTQKRLIGQVGSTGMSTGPHLHFAVRKNGAFVDPRKLKMSRGESIAKKDRAAFDAMVARRTSRLQTVALAEPPAAPEAEAASATADAEAPVALPGGSLGREEE
jgi:murein DD-endopeptidase MepM/ murein hydrolase activator NlpD